MEKKKCMYGAEIKIVLQHADEVWADILAEIFDGVMEKAKESYLECESKVIGYNVMCEYGEVKIKIMSGTEEITREIMDSLVGITGITPQYHEFGIYPPSFWQ